MGAWPDTRRVHSWGHDADSMVLRRGACRGPWLRSGSAEASAVARVDDRLLLGQRRLRAQSRNNQTLATLPHTSLAAHAGFQSHSHSHARAHTHIDTASPLSIRSPQDSPCRRRPRPRTTITCAGSSRQRRPWPMSRACRSASQCAPRASATATAQ
jgi:hypothetical protein